MNIKELLSSYNRIVIPRIQRDYAQGRKDQKTSEIRSNLLKDLFTKENIFFNMIFGESTEENDFIPIDGQQRITLLFLLMLYGYKVLGNEDFGLKKLHYETRKSSSEFWEFIINENWESLTKEKKEKSVSEWCKNLNGFQWYWSMDPTVQSMLVVLDDIHKLYHLSQSHFPNLLAIEFDNHDMTKSGLNETLYIKMNSRGKHLNPFEQIKSALDALVSNSTESYNLSVFDNYPWDINNTDMSFSKKWSYCMDREWSNWFWDEKTASLDGTLLKVILAYSYIFLICREDYEDYNKLSESDIERRKEEIIALIKKSSQEILASNNDVSPQFSHISIAYSKLKDKYNLTEDPTLKQEFLEGLSMLLSKLVQANCSFNSLWNDNVDFRNPELKYENKTLGILAALIFYKGNCYFGKDFNNWLRFCWNMVENTIEDSDTLANFSRNCKRYYSQGSTHILIWLNSPNAELPQKHSEQLDEEIFKALIHLQTVKKAESHILLKGRIRPLLLDENGNLSSKNFENRYNNFRAMFNNDGDVIEPAQFVRDYILCADTRNAMSYDYDSEWSIFRTSATAVKDKFNSRVYDSVWPYMFNTPLGHKTLIQRNSGQVAELHIREQLLTPGFIEAILSNKLWSNRKPRIRWYYGTYFLYPSDRRIDDYFIMLDWYMNENNDWNRMAINLLNTLCKEGRISINPEKTKPLIPDNPTSSTNFWMGKNLYFFYRDNEYMISKDYNISIVTENENSKEISLVGISTPEDFISILDRLQEGVSK